MLQKNRWCLSFFSNRKFSLNSAVNHFDLGHYQHALNDQIRYVLSRISPHKSLTTSKKNSHSIIFLVSSGQPIEAHIIKKTSVILIGTKDENLLENSKISNDELWSCRPFNRIMIPSNRSVIMMMIIIHWFIRNENIHL